MNIPAPTWTPSLSAYHGDFGRWSSSMVRCYRQSPALALQRYIHRDPAAQRSGTSEALVLGSAVNELVLDPAGTNLHVVEVQSRSTKAVRDAERAFPGRKVVTRKELDLAQRIADSILEPRTPAAELARTLLTCPGGHAEYAHRWEDPSGVPCRTLTDRVIPVHGRPAVLELKTSRSPERYGFQRQVFQLGYHEQAAWNCRGLADACRAAGEELEPDEPGFYWIVVRNSPPWEVFVYRRSESLRKLGEAALNETLPKLAQALQNQGDPAWWASPDEQLLDGEIPEIEAPAWALDAIESGAGDGPEDLGTSPESDL